MQDRPADFDSFVAQSTDTLMRTAYLIVWDLPEAEDLVQETLLKVARRWHRVRRMERPVAYARRMLVNLALGGAARHGRRRRELAGEALPDRPDPAADSAADRSERRTTVVRFDRRRCRRGRVGTIRERLAGELAPAPAVAGGAAEREVHEHPARICDRALHPADAVPATRDLEQRLLHQVLGLGKSQTIRYAVRMSVSVLCATKMSKSAGRSCMLPWLKGPVARKGCLQRLPAPDAPVVHVGVRVSGRRPAGGGRSRRSRNPRRTVNAASGESVEEADEHDRPEQPPPGATTGASMSSWLKATPALPAFPQARKRDRVLGGRDTLMLSVPLPKLG